VTDVQQATAQSWGSCNIYVAANPQVFADAYWEVNYLNVYQTTSPAAAAPPTPRSLSSYAGATWDASMTVPAPFPMTEGATWQHIYET